MDFTYFPFDKQTCQIHFIFRSLQSELRFVEAQDAFYVSTYTTDGEWIILDKTLSTVIIKTDYLKSEFIEPDAEAFIGLKLVLKRRPEFFIMTILAPVIFFSFLSSLVFILPQDTCDRASYASSLQVSMILFLGYIAEVLPTKTDPFPIILGYVFCLMSLSGFSVLATIVQLRIKELRERKSCLLDTCDGKKGPSGQKLDQIHQGQRSEGQEAMLERKSLNEGDKSMTFGQELNPTSQKDKGECHWNFICCVSTDLILFLGYVIIWSVVNVYFLTNLLYHI